MGSRGSTRPFPARTKPLIGAVNGPAITGGFEYALNCDFLIASERAVFADTHARVGVMPGWGLSVLLADAVGFRRAREISLSGNFVTADEALTWGLVNRVVTHDELLPTVRRIATDIAGNDPAGVARMLATYREQEDTALADGWRLEGDGARAFRADVAFAPDEVERRRQAIIDPRPHPALADYWVCSAAANSRAASSSGERAGVVAISTRAMRPVNANGGS